MDDVTFRCNVCGVPNTCARTAIQREVPSCAGCGSTLRVRAVVGLLSRELFGRALAIDDFPRRKDIRGIGLSDWEEYARRLAARLDYTNTYYHREPRLDIAEVPESLAGRYDFLIASDVFEHVAPPVSRAFQGARRLLKPGGLLILTVPYAIEVSHTREHFPTLHQWSLRQEADGWVLENRRPDGTEERFTDLVFHGGAGTTLEMRLFSEASLLAELREAGFDDVRVAADPMPGIGVTWPVSWSLPVVARAAGRTVTASTRSCST
jgi:SAM-dependent methyltransferase